MKEQASVIQEKTNDTINATKGTDTWEEQVFTLDSGACDHACSDSSIRVPTVPGEQSLRGVAYEVANGDEIPNLGEKQCIITTDEANAQFRSQCKSVTCTRISPPLGKWLRQASEWYSMARQMGGSFIECKRRGEKLRLQPDGNLWTLTAFVRKKPGEPQGFTRQRSSR